MQELGSLQGQLCSFVSQVVTNLSFFHSVSKFQIECSGTFKNNQRLHVFVLFQLSTTWLNSTVKLSAPKLPHLHHALLHVSCLFSTGPKGTNLIYMAVSFSSVRNSLLVTYLISAYNQGSMSSKTKGRGSGKQRLVLKESSPHFVTYCWSDIPARTYRVITKQKNVI